MAHIGGFVAGVVLVKLFLPGGRQAMRRPAGWPRDDRW
jgi:membrane associated rhomboid family serine protease